MAHRILEWENNSRHVSLPGSQSNHWRPLTESVDGTWSSSGTRIQGSLPQKRDPFPGQIILRSTPCRDQATDLTLESAAIMHGVVQMELLLPQG